ncbi:hypothetical protein LRB11_14585 [Ectothiorhodospira haloalkaliphila]|uniref:DUF6701 domain-containing protein n=1 Tax=Ectothiorhodospira haloalkaliphila TaxID=421628 RepID=UPI001EE8453A|nr:DUF6701 domain-containing protein [Ectothiorhodospira haloalkaliphila]MCG5526141.1 hypothetical protein [Ectothiorhodospira haloalkaliphila]
MMKSRHSKSACIFAIALLALAASASVCADYSISNKETFNRTSSATSIPDCGSSFTYLGESLDIKFTLTWTGDEDPPVDLTFTVHLRESDIELSDTPEWINNEAEATLKVPILSDYFPQLPAGPWNETISIQDISGGTLQEAPILFNVEIRLGRIRLDNALGSTDQLIARWRTEYWDSELGNGEGGWRPNQDDACTFFELTQVLYRTASNGAGSPIDNGNAPIISPESGTQFNRLTEPDEWNLDLSKGPGLMGFERIGTDRAWLEITFDKKDVESVFGPIDWARLSFGLHAGDENRVFTLEVP